MIQNLDKLEESISENSVWKKIVHFLNLHVDFNDHISISILDILVVITVIFITKIILKIYLRIVTRKIPNEDKNKFKVVYGYFKWLVGVGLALQTLFQDIISGVFILIDQSVHVGDNIEIEGKIGRVEEIKLRTTRAVTIDNKVLIIPNHLYLTNTLYNWTQNGTTTRESVSVGVAYGSDVELVKQLLIKSTNSHPNVLDSPEPTVIFTDFGDSALSFKIVFTINDSFKAQFIKSDIRFEIDKLFRKNNISIPFPQRDLHIIK